MRVWGRPLLSREPDGTPVYGAWTMVSTDGNGLTDMVYLTQLAQVLLLNTGESPFYTDWGIPAKDSVISQLFPDAAVALIQQRFSGYFGALFLARIDDPTPMYSIKVTTHAGITLDATIPIPM